MQQYMRYRVIEHENLEAMVDEVNLCIVEQWVPSGGVAYNPSQDTFMQAVYLHDFPRLALEDVAAQPDTNGDDL